MTQNERDKLAKLAGAEKKYGYHHHPVYVVFPCGWAKWQDEWYPESSWDDCRPLLEDINRRKLWCAFSNHLADTLGIGWQRPGYHETMRLALYQLTPADIVSTYLKTVKE